MVMLLPCSLLSFCCLLLIEAQKFLKTMYKITDYLRNGMLYLNNILRPQHKKLSTLMIRKRISVAIDRLFYSIRNLHSFEKEIGKIFDDYGKDVPSLGNISLRLILFYGFYNLTYHFFNRHYPK